MEGKKSTIFPVYVTNVLCYVVFDKQWHKPDEVNIWKVWQSLHNFVCAVHATSIPECL